LVWLYRIVGILVAVFLIVFFINLLSAEAANAYTDTMYQCRKLTEYYYDCWTFRNYNWFEELWGLRDLWFWKRI